METALKEKIDTDRIRLSNPLIETLESELGVRGQRSGAWTMFLCPFHPDNETPSLGVIEDHWQCFGCGEKGDVIEFVMKRRGLEFRDACTHLSNGLLPGEALRTVMEAREKRQREADKAQLDARAAWAARRPWESCHAALGPTQRAWWRSRGVPDEWQDNWQLGYTPDRPFKVKDDLLHSPAYTIPYLRWKAEPATMQYRLTSHPPGQKYRFEHKLGRAYFLADPERGLRGPGLIVEGAIKAMVAHRAVGGLMQVIGLPSKSDFAGLDAALRGHRDAWWVILDPDALRRPQGALETAWEPSPVKLARAIGAKARVVQMPGKLDDMLLAEEKPLTREGLKWLLQHCGRSFA